MEEAIAELGEICKRVNKIRSDLQRLSETSKLKCKGQITQAGDLFDSILLRIKTLEAELESTRM